ncbi:MAG TPA: CHAP domain-containing protein [Amycolatopsis sp.]|jgi:surface antigen|nr:CHAP domain-containing protein [Amycolatopsis sp.]
MSVRQIAAAAAALGTAAVLTAGCGATPVFGTASSASPTSKITGPFTPAPLTNPGRSQALPVANGLRATSGYQVRTWGAPLNVRSAADTSAGVVGSLNQGTRVNIECTAQGTNVQGPNGWSTVWDRIGAGRWVADSFVYTGTMDPVAPACAPATGSAPLDPATYPWPNLGADQWVDDGHGYFAGECVSFAAWAVRNDNVPDHASPDRLGDAEDWDNAGQATVVSTPRVGDVAQWDANHNYAGDKGHVAYVAAVNNGTVTVWEYNFGTPHRFNTRTIPISDPSRYLRF